MDDSRTIAATTPAAPLALPAHPRFARHLSVERVEGQGVVVHGERQLRILAGALHERLAALLDGRTSADDIADRLEEDFSPAEVFYVLLGLQRDGLLVDGTGDDAAGSDDATAAFWDSIGDHGLAARQLARTPISIVATDDVDGRRWHDSLAGHGFRLEPAAPLTLVVTADYLDATLGSVNTSALAEERRWLLCRPVGTQLWLGPLFVPGVTACWECLRHRLARNHPVRAFLARHHGRPPLLPCSAAPWTHEAAAGVVATQLARLLVQEAPRELAGTLTRLDTVTLESTRHAVTRRPQCPACGDPTLMARRAGGEPTLRSSPKGHTTDGGHRRVTPQETVERLSPLIDPLTGAITELRRIPYDDASIHVYTSGLNGANVHRDLSRLHAGLRRSSSGKGFTDAQARASALGEAVERHSAIFQGDEPRIRGTYRELGDAAIHPARCLHYSAAQYAARARQPAAGAGNEWIPVPFDEEATIDWSPIWSMTERRTRYLPTTLLYLAHRSSDHPFGLGDSNGNAAGNTLEEAVLQGFLELVERDSTAIWWYNRVVRPAVDPDSLEIPGWEAIRGYYREIGRELWLLDITADFGIPALVAVSRLAGGAREEILLGLGAHLDPRIAASRAVSEMNQMLAALEALREGGGEDHTLARWLGHATVRNQPYLAPAPGAARRLADLPHVAHADLLDDVRWCQRAVEARGLELLVLDQTRPDVGVPVVKVVVPDLRHFRARFAPGRLYDVPVALGWLSRPIPEPELNPTPFFL